MLRFFFSKLVFIGVTITWTLILGCQVNLKTAAACNERANLNCGDNVQPTLITPIEKQNLTGSWNTCLVNDNNEYHKESYIFDEAVQFLIHSLTNHSDSLCTSPAIAETTNLYRIKQFDTFDTHSQTSLQPLSPLRNSATDLLTLQVAQHVNGNKIIAPFNVNLEPNLQTLPTVTYTPFEQDNIKHLHANDNYLAQTWVSKCVTQTNLSPVLHQVETTLIEKHQGLAQSMISLQRHKDEINTIQNIFFNDMNCSGDVIFNQILFNKYSIDLPIQFNQGSITPFRLYSIYNNEHIASRSAYFTKAHPELLRMWDNDLSATPPDSINEFIDPSLQSNSGEPDIYTLAEQTFAHTPTMTELEGTWQQSFCWRSDWKPSETLPYTLFSSRKINIEASTGKLILTERFYYEQNDEQGEALCTRPNSEIVIEGHFEMDTMETIEISSLPFLKVDVTYTYNHSQQTAINRQQTFYISKSDYPKTQGLNLIVTSPGVTPTWAAIEPAGYLKIN